MPAPVFVASTTDDESLRAKLGVLPRLFSYGKYVFLLAPHGGPHGCAETPVWDLVKDDANRKAEYEAFNSSGHSLYFYADGNVSNIVNSTLDDECLKEAVSKGVPPADSGTPAVRVFTVSKDGVSIK